MTKYCCNSFEANFRAMDKKERGIVVTRSDLDGMLYQLEYNVFNSWDLDEVKNELVKSNFNRNIGVQGSVHIKFCPWCGTNLRAFIEENQVD